jgi:hypothetical protein
MIPVAARRGSLNTSEILSDRFQIAKVVLDEIKFTRSHVPTVNKQHVFGLDPLGGAIHEHL